MIKFYLRTLIFMIGIMFLINMIMPINSIASKSESEFYLKEGDSLIIREREWPGDNTTGTIIFNEYQQSLKKYILSDIDTINDTMYNISFQVFKAISDYPEMNGKKGWEFDYKDWYIYNPNLKNNFPPYNMFFYPQNIHLPQFWNETNIFNSVYQDYIIDPTDLYVNTTSETYELIYSILESEATVFENTANFSYYLDCNVHYIQLDEWYREYQVFQMNMEIDDHSIVQYFELSLNVISREFTEYQLEGSKITYELMKIIHEFSQSEEISGFSIEIILIMQILIYSIYILNWKRKNVEKIREI